MRIIKSKKAYNQVLEKEKADCICDCISWKCQTDPSYMMGYSAGFGDTVLA